MGSAVLDNAVQDETKEYNKNKNVIHSKYSM